MPKTVKINLIARDGDKYSLRKVEVTKTHFKNFKGMKFGVHECMSGNGKICISELTSGLFVSGGDNEKKAKDNAKHALELVGMDVVNSKMENIVQGYGFKYPVNGI